MRNRAGKQTVKGISLKYTLEINDQKHLIQSVIELQAYFDEASKYTYADLSLSLKCEETPTMVEKVLGQIDRLVGVSPINEFSYMGALINRDENAAFLTFTDERDVSFHSLRSDLSKSAKNNVKFFLGNGQSDEYPAIQCVQVEQARQAFVYFFETGKKPNWIHWVSEE